MKFTHATQRRLALTAFAVSACFAASPSAFAWGAGGHMIVAQIAYDKISAEDPAAKAAVDRLLKVQIAPPSETGKSTDFVNAAHWADDVRTVDGFQDTAAEHFIDQPFTQDGTTLPSDLPQADNVVVALTKYVGILRSNNSDDATKARALRFVIHFVGDVHQPLHCATRVSAANAEGDRGGNLVSIRDTVGTTHPKVNLHSYWDGGLTGFPREGAHFAPPPLSEVSSAAAAITGKYTLDDQWKVAGPYNYADWAKESFTIASTFVYNGIASGQVPSDDYVTKGQSITQYRVLTAGYRLAALLEAIWPNQN
ncbi:MAG TPA: S1/P1 nuclease [Burkholderiaceae bacterium]